MERVGTREWNNQMFQAHPTPYSGIAGWIEKQRLKIIIKYIHQFKTSEDVRIVELGCESGYLLQAIQESFPSARLTGVDISDLALKQAEMRLSPIHLQLLQADICEPIPLQESFDFIICSETLEHIPDYKKALEQIENLSQTKSVVILTVPLEGLKNFIKSILRKFGLMKLLFNGIEEGFSDWHVQDFKKNDFQRAVGEEFEIIKYQSIWGLHQLILAKKKTA